MSSETGQLIRAGDAVLHHPSGETWLVATDEDDGMFYAAGWPETRAHAEHCEIVRTATDEQRLKMLEQASHGKWSPRQSQAKYQLDQCIKRCHECGRRGGKHFLGCWHDQFGEEE